MGSTTTILFLIYALSAYIVNATLAPDVPPFLRTGKRAGVNVTVFNDTNCGGYNRSNPDVKLPYLWNRTIAYGKMSTSNTTVNSYILSRFLSPDERLDWSNPYPSNATSPDPRIPQACGTFVQRTSPDSNGNRLHDSVCYPLKPGATCVNLWNIKIPPPDTINGSAAVYRRGY